MLYQGWDDNLVLLLQVFDCHSYWRRSEWLAPVSPSPACWVSVHWQTLRLYSTQQMLPKPGTIHQTNQAKLSYCRFKCRQAKEVIYSGWGSNPQPPACKSGDLQTEQSSGQFCRRFVPIHHSEITVLHNSYNFYKSFFKKFAGCLLAHLSTKCSSELLWSFNVRRPSSVRASVNNFFKQHLLWNHLLDFDQTSQEWSLGGPLSKLFKPFQLVA